MTLKELRKHAEENVIPFSTLVDMYKQDAPPIGDNPDFVVKMDKARVVFSVENQKRMLCRHLSVSFRPGTGGEEMKDLVESYKVALGFDLKMPIEQWIENEFAVNVLQPMLN